MYVQKFHGGRINAQQVMRPSSHPVTIAIPCILRTSISGDCEKALHHRNDCEEDCGTVQAMSAPSSHPKQADIPACYYMQIRRIIKTRIWRNDEVGLKSLLRLTYLSAKRSEYCQTWLELRHWLFRGHTLTKSAKKDMLDDQKLEKASRLLSNGWFIGDRLEWRQNFHCWGWTHQNHRRPLSLTENICTCTLKQHDSEVCDRLSWNSYI